jgi:glycerate 2-kinase
MSPILTEPASALAEIARRIAAVALAAVDPERLVRDALVNRLQPWGGVLAIGKAAAALARGVQGHVPADARRLMVRPERSLTLLDPAWEQLAGGHPLPDRRSITAGERALAWLGDLDRRRPLLALISGGSSACVDAMAPGIRLEDLVSTQRALLGSGQPIAAFNAVRKHISRFKGGGALRACPSAVLVLLLSDVPGDDPSTIGSGPFVADPTTYATALAALAGLEIPNPVREHLGRGLRGEIPETLKPGDLDLERVECSLLGGNRTAREAARLEAVRSGFAVAVGDLVGEAAVAGAELVRAGRNLPGPRVALLVGGETTVTLGPQPGIGGRNQEMALAAARELSGRSGELVLTLATDGEDGPTKAAGALVDNGTWTTIAGAGLDPATSLRTHDANPALARVPDALLEPGQTGTNVADLALYLRWQVD